MRKHVQFSTDRESGEEEFIENKIEKYIDIKNNNFYIDVYYDNLLHKRIRLTTDNDIKKANIFNIFYEIMLI